MELIAAARSIANLAIAQGVQAISKTKRAESNHLGALLADAVLQAGLNYSTVVRPRVERIMREYPDATDIEALIGIVSTGSIHRFLNWNHPTKATRFQHVVVCLYELNVSETQCLRARLFQEPFRERLRSINGIGPKTIDYLACLVGIDSIAVDRHVRSFASKAGVINNDYQYLKSAFCFAADLLSLPRREFDAWIWRSYAQSKTGQLEFAL